MSQGLVTLEVRDGVGHVCLNRPQSSNALTLDLVRDLFEVARMCDDDPAVRAVLLRGEGERFCAGGDLREFAAQGEALPTHLKRISVHFHGAVSRLARMDAPVVAAVQGAAAGGGLALACGCDITIAAESARFTMAYTRLGLIPDGGASFFLPRLVGLKRAMDLTLTNRVISAQEARELGLVSRVVPDSELRAESEATARELAAGATRALGGAKRLLRSGWSETLETQLEHESRSMAEAAATADAHEGIPAFLEKRAPRFGGR